MLKPKYSTRFVLFVCGIMLLLTACQTGPGPTPTPAKFKLDVQVTGQGTVKGNNSPAIDCPGTCSADYNNDVTIRLTATPTTGHRFTGWGGACSGTGTTLTCDVQMSAVKTVTAGFQAEPPPSTGTLQVTINGLSAGVNANVVVAGPDNFNRTLLQTTTLDNRQPGSYTVTANNVNAGADSYTATVTGSPANVQANQTATVTVNYTLVGASSRIDNVEIVSPTGYQTSTQVRQGLGDIVLIVTGAGLNGVSNPRLGDVRADGSFLSGTITMQSDSSVRIIFDGNEAIPHAARLGAKTLSFPNGPSFPNAITVTPIVLSPSGQNTNAGTFDRPFASFDAPFTAENGDTIYMLNGTYRRNANYNVPRGVTLEGESANVILQADNPMVPSNGLTFDGSATVKNITLNGFAVGMTATQPGDVVLNSVTVQNSTNRALSVANATTVTADNSRFLNNEADSIVVGGTATFTMTGGESSNNGNTGLWITGANPTVSLDGVKVSNNGQNGVLPDGIEMDVAGANGSLTVRNSSIEENQRHGVLVLGNPAKVDFGTTTEPGNNTIRNNRRSAAIAPANKWEFSDERAARAMADGPIITLVGSSLQGRNDLTGSVTGINSFTNAGVNYWRITNLNNRILLPTP